MAKLPQLYTARQFAAKIGVSYPTLYNWLSNGRIPDAQLLPCGWIIPEGAGIYVKGTDIDLPPEMLLGHITPLEKPKYKSRPGNKKGLSDRRTVVAEGLRIVRKDLGMSIRGMAKVTGMSANTIMRMEKGEKVRVQTVHKIARTLRVGVEDLLRNPMYIPEGY